ncbi:MAG: pyridoxamine 5'-phosphate oxidase family protein [Syntrophomonas sp.]
MQEIIKFLQENNMGCFATVEQGQPRVRPWQFQFELDGKLYFGTSNKKRVFKQLKETPYAAFASFSPTMATVRLTGQVVFDSTPKMKDMILKRNPMLQKIYGTPDNIDRSFEVFYLCNGEASYTEFGKEPLVYKF